MTRSFVAAVALFCLSGCAGYHVGSVKPNYLRDVKSIAVQNFKNASFRPRVETLVANSVIKQFQQDGTFRITTSDKADAVLEGTISSVGRNPARSVRGNVLATREFNLTVTVAYTLRGRDGKPLVGPASISGATSFFVGSDVTTDERQALPLAAEELAVRLVSQISEGW
ncbi:MAG: LPS assembly lipoprotein LptE [Verrucomicrobiota bacterium]|nr:LPS assembly lipoprotein LptE [Verrucomicrobiota bacterium]